MNIQQLHQHFLESTGICTDTRKVEKDQLFFALKGPNFDANKFAIKALEAGCKLAVVDDLAVSNNHDQCIYVEDGLTALQQLANFHRKQFQIPVLGITGTNGKTTNKELIFKVLSQQFNVCCTQGNLNNHIGVPLTLLQLTNEHEIAIIEMGANHIGEIGELCAIAEPTLGLITSIGIAHLEGFGSLEGVKKAKRDLYDYVVETNGICFVNERAAHVANLYAGNPEDAIFYGSNDNLPNFKVESTSAELSVNVKEGDSNISIHSHLIGNFHGNNILNTYVIGRHFNIAPQAIAQAIADYAPTNNRSQQIEWQGNKVILDAYNANPTSMEAAIQSFSKIDHAQKLPILGDMLELGDESMAYHQQIIELLQTLKFVQAYLVGAEFAKCILPNQFTLFENVDALKQQLEKDAFKDYQILVKGSRGIQLEKAFQ